MRDLNSIIKKLKILLIAAMYNEGKESNGYSYEYYNIFQSLQNIVGELNVFDFMQVLKKKDIMLMNQNLLDIVKKDQPDLVIFVPYTNQFIPSVIDEISKFTITVGYFFDDMWRIEYARFWANHFSFITTSDINGVKKFRDVGFSNVIYSPFACNHKIFIKKNLPKKYDVTFIGAYHPYRSWYINKLIKSGINVKVWGPGWGSNRISQKEMVDIFNQSRINLNLSNSISWDIRYITSFSRPIKESLRVWKNTYNAFVKQDMKIREQVKGRHFEINACGGFQLSFYVEGLEHHYTIGNEIEIYQSYEELIEKIQHFLKHEDECRIIAQNGYLRTLKDHTMEKRFLKLFEDVGLLTPQVK